jgi:hypothetical protein
MRAGLGSESGFPYNLGSALCPLAHLIGEGMLLQEFKRFAYRGHRLVPPEDVVNISSGHSPLDAESREDSVSGRIP